MSMDGLTPDGDLLALVLARQARDWRAGTLVPAEVYCQLYPELASDPPARLDVVLAEVRDPGNAGAVVRAADAAGADGVIVTAQSVDMGNAKVVRSTAGSLFHLPVVQEAEFADVVAAARRCGMQVLAADGSGDPLADVDLSRPTVWVFGNEAWGLPGDVAAACDRVVALPIYGKAESLNLATAAAVCLYASAGAQSAAQ